MLDYCFRAKAARKAREAGQSEKRRKMREDLEKRESTWQTARTDEQRARNKLKVVIAVSSQTCGPHRYKQGLHAQPIKQLIFSKHCFAFSLLT